MSVAEVIGQMRSAVEAVLPRLINHSDTSDKQLRAALAALDRLEAGIEVDRREERLKGMYYHAAHSFRGNGAEIGRLRTKLAAAREKLAKLEGSDVRERD